MHVLKERPYLGGNANLCACIHRLIDTRGHGGAHQYKHIEDRHAGIERKPRWGQIYKRMYIMYVIALACAHTNAQTHKHTRVGIKQTGVHFKELEGMCVRA